MAQLMLKMVVDKTGVNRKSVRSTGVATVMTLALMLAVATASAAEQEQPRLKFRGKGPVCSCASGMSEADIRKAWEARFTQSENTRSEHPDGRPATRDEKRRGVDEAQPR